MKGKRPRRAYIIPAAIVILIVAIVTVHARRGASNKQEPQTAVVARGEVLSSVSGNGLLQPLTTIEVKSNVGGQVVELAVDEGDRVRAGQLIARIDPSDSISALDQATADYASASAKVQQSKQALSMQRLQTTAGIVSAEQALGASRERLAQAEQQAKTQPKLTAESIKQAQSALASARANLDQTKSALIPQKIASAKASHDDAKASFTKAERNVERQRALLGKGYVSQSQADEAEAQFSAARAQYDVTKSKLDTVNDEADQDLRNAEAKVAQAESALESARANAVQNDIKLRDLAAARAAVKQAEASLAAARASAYQDQIKSGDILQSRAQLERAKATVKNARTQLGYTTIIAPRSGVVVKKYVEAGSIVTAGRQAMAGSGSGVTIVEIADISKMRVVVDVDESDISRITLGQEVDVTVDACPNELFPAKVIKVAPMAEVNQSVTTVPVTVELEQTDSRLKPEMNATCDFVIARKEKVLYVPIEAISETDTGTEVTVLDHGRQVTRKVQVGLAGDDYAEVASGLKEGETVVIPEEEATQKTAGPGGPGGGPPPPM